MSGSSETANIESDTTSTVPDVSNSTAPLEQGMTDLNVSSSESAKGGIKYDVVLRGRKENAATLTPTAVLLQESARPKSAELIEKKIEAAAGRRQFLEAERLAALGEKLRRVEEAAKKRLSFSLSTKENLEHKIETSAAIRESLITDTKQKLSSHNTHHLQEVRDNSLTTQKEFGDLTLLGQKNKLEVAEKNREKAKTEKLESLKKHDEKIELVRNRKSSIVVSEDPALNTDTASE